MGLVARVFGGKGWQAKTYAEKEGTTWTITPALFYPAMIEHIRESLESDDLPAELIDKRINPNVDPCLAARRYRNWARRISDRAWSDALAPLADLSPDITRIAHRAEALECARLWFTRALKNAEGPPIYIRILRDVRFRLGIDLEFRA